MKDHHAQFQVELSCRRAVMTNPELSDLNMEVVDERLPQPLQEFIKVRDLSCDQREAGEYGSLILVQAYPIMPVGETLWIVHRILHTYIYFLYKYF